MVGGDSIGTAMASRIFDIPTSFVFKRNISTVVAS
jgi:hypothetical protein